MREPPSECQVKVDTCIEALSLDGEQPTLGVKRCSLRDQHSEHVRQPVGISLAGDDARMGGLLRGGGQSDFLLGEQTFGGEAALDLGEGA